MKIFDFLETEPNFVRKREDFQHLDHYFKEDDGNLIGITFVKGKTGKKALTWKSNEDDFRSLTETPIWFRKLYVECFKKILHQDRIRRLVHNKRESIANIISVYSLLIERESAKMTLTWNPSNDKIEIKNEFLKNELEKQFKKEGYRTEVIKNGDCYEINFNQKTNV